MFCTKCGKENNDGAKFCTGCGNALSAPETPVVAPVEAPAPVAPVEPVAPVVAPASAPAPQQPKKKTGLIIGIVAGVVAIIVIVLGVLFATGAFGGDKDKDDKKDKKETTTVEETTVEETTTETTTEAPTIYGTWEASLDGEEDGMKWTMVCELTINEDGSYELICVDYDIDKDDFVEYVVDGIEAELTEAEIQQFLDMYGYDSLEDYASQYYDTQISEIKEEYDGRVIKSGENFEDEIEYELNGDTLVTIEEGEDDWEFTRK